MKLLIAGLCLSASLLLAADKGVTGNWKVTTNVAGNEGQASCTFALKDTLLSGTCKGDDGVAHDVTGKVEEKTVSFQYKIEYNGEPLTLVFTGTVDSDSALSGTVDVQPMGIGGDFNAKKQ